MKLATTPYGTRDWLFAECALRQETEKRLTRCFQARGYREIVTPLTEYYDLILQSGNPVRQDELFVLPERSGKLMALRPDMTTSIARVAATKLTGDVPQRFCYVQDVFRTGAAPGRVQVRQAGVELLGAVGIRADAEIIALAAEALAHTAGSYRIEIGHAGFYRSLAASLNENESFLEELRSLINRKNFAALTDLLAPYRDTPAYAALCRLPQLFGGEEVLDEALALANGCAATTEIEYLREIFRELQAAGFGSNVMIDLGLVHHMDYYTGVVFRGYVAGAGSPVLSGGRYDGLTGLLGKSMPATGFSADVEALCAAMPPMDEEPLRYLLHIRRGALRRAMDFMDSRAGQCALSPFEDEADSAALASKQGARLIVIE